MSLDVQSLARHMIAIDSSSTVSNMRLVEFLVPLCHLAGLSTTLQEENRDGLTQFNLLASRRPLDRGTLLLASHTDTVSPGDHSLWTASGGDPFALTENDGLLYGLGVADVKLDLLCKLAALESLRHARLRDNVALACTYGEETGRYGAKLLVRELWGQDGSSLPRRVLVGEPTRLRACTAHKGYTEFRVIGSDPSPMPPPPYLCWRLEFTGTTAHSSQPDQGASANTACLEVLARWAAETGGADRGNKTGTEAAYPTGKHPKGVFAVLSVHGGDAVNKVAARCDAVVATASAPRVDRLVAAATEAGGVTLTVKPTQAPTEAVWSPELTRALFAAHSHTCDLRGHMRALEAPGFEPPCGTANNGLIRLERARLSYVVDTRTIPGPFPDKVLDDYEVALRSLETPAPPHSEVFRLRAERVLDSAPFRVAEDSEVLEALMTELGIRGLPLEPELKSGTTEAPVYQEAGMDVVVFGPGEAAGNIHRPNERVPLSDLAMSVEIYRDMILRLCGA